MLKVEVQYVDFGNIEALPLASLREPTRAISHVNSLPFQVLHPTCLFVPCSPSPSLPALTDTPLHLSFRVISNPSLPFQVPHPHVLLCLSLAALFPYGYPSLFVLTLPRSLFLRVPTPLVVFPSPLALFPYRYPSLIVFLFPTSLCSL